jgi:uncharacterized protein DUF1524
MLRTQLTDVVFKAGTRDCKVLAGTLEDPYTGHVLRYSADDANTIHVDYLVSLAPGWDAGAWAWNLNQRIAFANDPDNLIVVSAEANILAKSDAGLEWLPPNPAYRCTYVIRYLSVSSKYDLPITRADRGAAIAACPQATRR